MGMRWDLVVLLHRNGQPQQEVPEVGMCKEEVVEEANEENISLEELRIQAKGSYYTPMHGTSSCCQL